MSSSPEPDDPGLTNYHNPRQLVRQMSLELDLDWVPDDPVPSPKPIFVVVLDSESKDDNKEESDEERNNDNDEENETNKDDDEEDDGSNSDKQEKKELSKKIVPSKI